MLEGLEKQFNELREASHTDERVYKEMVFHHSSSNTMPLLLSLARSALSMRETLAAISGENMVKSRRRADWFAYEALQKFDKLVEKMFSEKP